jgi:hypothetical protein
MLTRYNRKTVTVITGDGQRWNVSPRLLGRWMSPISPASCDGHRAAPEDVISQLTLTGAFSTTGSGNTIQNPWGTYPGFLSLIDVPAAQNLVLPAPTRSRGSSTGVRRSHRCRHAYRIGLLGGARHALDEGGGKRP